MQRTNRSPGTKLLPVGKTQQPYSSYSREKRLQPNNKVVNAILLAKSLREIDTITHRSEI